MGGPGRPRTGVRKGYLLGLAASGVVAGTGLALANWMLSLVLFRAPAVRWVAVAAIIVALTAAVTAGKSCTRLAGNFTVPAEWVVHGESRTGLLWGLILGLGFVTQSPGCWYFGGMALALLLGHPAQAFVVGLAFALSRGVMVNRWLRAKVLAGMEQFVITRRGEVRRRTILVTRRIVLAWTALAVTLLAVAAIFEVLGG